jgi:Family of unknown function (DUF6178)
MSGRTSADSQTVPLSRFRALLARPRGQRRMEALLAADDPEAAVAALPATELYQILTDVGLGEAAELVALATPEQLRGCLDIDVWDRDHLQLAALTPWLQALVETGYEKLAEVWEKLDPELTALILQRHARIYDRTLEEAPPEDAEGPILQTPDTFFAIEILAEDDDTMHLVQRLLDDLYRADPSGVLTRHSLMAARSEPAAELEEMSYRWRAGRMADLGYVDYYEALEVFRPLDAASVHIGEGTEDRFAAPDPGDPEETAGAFGLMPAAVAEGVVGASFLARALDHIGRLDEPDEIARLETAVVVLVNNVLAATRVPPADAGAVKRGAEQAAGTVSLGLEALSHGDVERAAQALRSVSLTRLHRLGHTVTLRLARMARALAPRAVAAGEPDGSALAALLRPRPLYATVLDSPPGMDARPFASMEDVRRVAEMLTRLALRIAVVDSLGVDLLALAERPAPRPTLDDYVRTALVRAALGQPFAATPIEPSDVLALCRTRLDQGRLSAAARDSAARGVLTSLDRAQVTAGRHLLPGLLDAWLADIDERIGALPTDRAPDPRFLDGFVWAG